MKLIAPYREVKMINTLPFDHTDLELYKLSAAAMEIVHVYVYEEFK